MSTTIVKTPTSILRFGHARVDVTPPVGIYHRLWGAARHDQATGVHRPLVADVLVVAPIDGSAEPFVRANFDFCGLVEGQQNDLRRALAAAVGVSIDRVVIAHSHTHSSGWFIPDRFTLPGGDLIQPFLDTVKTTLVGAGHQALTTVDDASILYGVGRCDLAANRDYWDADLGGYACGFNPDSPADDTLVVAKVVDGSNRLRLTLVNYGCHPTTLAWDNSLISPDYVGAMRETVEAATGVPCVFAQGACGDLGPRRGFVGDLAVADTNGRQLGYAALSALTTLTIPRADFVYDGTVVSGATLGIWSYHDQDSRRIASASRFSGGTFAIDLPLKPRPVEAEIRADLSRWESTESEAAARGDARGSRDARARAERSRRWLARLADIPPGATKVSVGYSVYRLGDAVWITTGGEPYNVAQVELRRRFPEETILFSPLTGSLEVAYLLPVNRYGAGLYQEEPSILAPGCLEALVDAISRHVATI
ncbi:MAG TPA: hypothetical protein VKT80_05675 [Chloroflexota bacterium]|nr:hypothetical protein [Chloroflexota bacterium]